jgi:hypothetical protein
MKIVRATILASALIFVAPVCVDLQPAAARGEQTSSLASLLAQYPDGGEGLANAVANLLASQPSKARQLAGEGAALGNADQRSAVALGFARALARLDSNPQTAAQASELRSAINPRSEFGQLIGGFLAQIASEGGEYAHGAARERTTFFSPGGGGFSAGGAVRASPN